MVGGLIRTWKWVQWKDALYFLEYKVLHDGVCSSWLLLPHSLKYAPLIVQERFTLRLAIPTSSGVVLYRPVGSVDRGVVVTCQFASLTAVSGHTVECVNGSESARGVRAAL